VVRNPFSRVVSWYHWHDQTWRWPSAVRPWFCGSFAEWVLLGMPVPDELSKVPPLMYNMRLHVDDGDGGVLKGCNVFKLEDLSDPSKSTWDELVLAVGCENAKLFPQHNTSVHKPWQEYYTPELRRIVEDRCGEDLDFFGYKFE